MAILKCNIRSDELCQQVSFNAIIPQNMDRDIKTLYLLHGLSDDENAWCRYTSIERYANELNIAVIMPNAARSFYTDMAYGRRYYSYVSDELIKISRTMFRLSTKREDTFIAGLSMGGYGAFKIALSKPDIFFGAASLSGALDSERLVKDGNFQTDKFLIVGENGTKKENDLFYLVEQIEKNNLKKPKLYQCCGTEDFLYEDNKRFKAFIINKGFTYKYEESAGDHNWLFWDTYIQNALKYMFNTTSK